MNTHRIIDPPFKAHNTERKDNSSKKRGKNEDDSRQSKNIKEGYVEYEEHPGENAYCRAVFVSFLFEI